MGGVFGVASHGNCILDLFYGTDYHSHLGTMRGGMAVCDGNKLNRIIHNISNAQFRSKFEGELAAMRGSYGVGVISDFEDQPLIIASHLGVYAIVTVGVVKNLEKLTKQAYQHKITHFSEMNGGQLNPTEVIATLINQGSSFAEGINIVQENIEGSCTLLLLCQDGIYAARDKYGRTPLVIGKKDGTFAVSSETCAFPNLDFQVEKYLGPGEIVHITADKMETIQKARKTLRICSFLWIYYGYPSSSYEGINVEDVRNRCGAALARQEKEKIDYVAGIPDSGSGHAIGFAAEAGLPYKRPFVKYTPTWPRSFMPQDQAVRNLVATMKLLPIKEFIQDKSLLFCEDSIVRGTQLKFTIERLFRLGAKAVHMRPACPPLIFGCRFLNFSRSASDLDLIARKTIQELEGANDLHLDEYTKAGTDRHQRMVAAINKKLGFTSLRYQQLADMVKAIGLAKDKLCTYCWDGIG
jgi:amidophosphoribosyltransferase